ncbi:signal recognition particle-docking protein FtsY [Lawsonia intracellularis]|uniref:signal recognition particle-docking protein FtsY n=1 Tax=Lawsonia intracellularis TaxID=29546 RepID=UPI001F5C08F5|nr:signal recognition particle-docking protein FtsY [Lawsonia intracellularis]UYH53247.1 signal recognition particle-docking protein FtsY [Lawsonia intracellularis]
MSNIKLITSTIQGLSMGFFSSLKNALLSSNSKVTNSTKLNIELQPSTTTANDGWKEQLIISLRQAKPQLSLWLDLTLKGITHANEQLWERVTFLLVTLGVSENEARAFTQNFQQWSMDLGYTKLSDFRSELQYRLSLTLELEDEESEQNRLLTKIHTGLAKTREHLSQGLKTVFSHHKKLSNDFWDELEELFILSDMGVETAEMLTSRLKIRATKANISIPEELSPLLANELEIILKISPRVLAINPPEVILLIGVNGVGKTTTIAKLAYRMHLQGKKVLLAAADTFRAAAIEQLEVWAQRIGIVFYTKGTGADPAAVAWEAVEHAIQKQFDVVLIDTAGRLHTKTNLMDELSKIRNVIAKKHPGAPHRTILIIDATTGQNALQQTKVFKESTGIDEIIVTKLDGTAKGGVAIAVSLQYGIPITYVGLGEKMEDLQPFNGEKFAKALLNI